MDLSRDTAAMSILAWIARRIGISGEGLVAKAIHEILELFDGLPMIPIDPICVVESLLRGRSDG